MLPIIISVCILALLIGSWTDIKTREVPDWLNYSLICIGLGIHTLYSIIFTNASFLIQSLTGFLTFLILAYLMFYLGQWGGGDSKMIMGLGALIGLELNLDSFLLGFFLNILLIGAIYGLIYSIILALKHKKKFVKEIKKIIKDKKLIKVKIALFIISLVLFLPLLLLKDLKILIPLLLLIIMINLTHYLWSFVKAVEIVSMYKYITPDKLTEGDWIAKKIKIDGNYICGPKDLGIEKKQIKQLIDLWKKGKIKKILIKEGMPFIPPFLISFIITLIWGNLFFLILT